MSLGNRLRRRVWVFGGHLGLAGGVEVVEGGLEALRHGFLEDVRLCFTGIP
jgi:hypothetical protein